MPEDAFADVAAAAAKMCIRDRSGWKGSIWSSFSPMPANLMGLPVKIGRAHV